MISTGVRVPPTPWAMAFDPITDRVWVACRYSGVVSVVERGGEAVLSVVETGYAPCGLALAAGLRRVYAVHHLGSTLVAIDADAMTKVAESPSGFLPVDVTVDETSNRVFTADSAGRGVSVFDATTLEPLEKIAVDGNPSSVGASGDDLYVVTSDAVWSRSGSGPFQLIAIQGPGKVSVREDGTAFVTENSGGKVAAVRAADVLRRTEVGDGPWAVSASPSHVYVALQDGRVLAIHGGQTRAGPKMQAGGCCVAATPDGVWIGSDLSSKVWFDESQTFVGTLTTTGSLA